MTPQEKAKELVEKFGEVEMEVWDGETQEYFKVDLSGETAKQCAILCVDEVIKVCPLNNFKDVGKECDFIVEEHPQDFEEYWQQVKTEIEKL